MDERAMIKLAILPLPLLLLVCFLSGLVLGYLYFRALRQNANLIVRQGHPLLGMILTLGRMVLLFAGFYLAVLAGGFALLAALAGVLTVQDLMLRQARRTEA